MGNYFGSTKSNEEEIAGKLLTAAMGGNLEEMKELVGSYLSPEVKASHIVNMQDPSGNAAIHGAVFSNHLDVVKFLVEDCEADLYAKNGIGCSPIWLAAGYGYGEMLGFLLRSVQSDPDKDFLEVIGEGNSSGDSPIIAAARKGHSNIIRMILSEVESAGGFDGDQSINSAMKKILTQKNNAGDNVLSVGTASGFLEVINEVLDWDLKYSSADNDNCKLIDVKNKKGLTPLLVAAERGDKNIFLRLLKENPQDALDGNGMSPFSVAVFCGCFEIVEALLELPYGKNMIDVKDEKSGRTPLWLSARTGNKKIAALLLKHGADRTIKDDNEGLTPEEAARKFKKQQVLELFE